MISKDILDRCVGFSSVYNSDNNQDTIILTLTRKGWLIKRFLPYTYLRFKFTRRTELKNGRYWFFESSECRKLIDQLVNHFSELKKEAKE